MIKAITADGTLIFGLSDENLKRLRAGKPISIDLAHMGKSGKILILHGATEEKIVEALKPYMTADTRIHGREN